MGRFGDLVAGGGERQLDEEALGLFHAQAQQPGATPRRCIVLCLGSGHRRPIVYSTLANDAQVPAASPGKGPRIYIGCVPGVPTNRAINDSNAPFLLEIWALRASDPGWITTSRRVCTAPFAVRTRTTHWVQLTARKHLGHSARAQRFLTLATSKQCLELIIGKTSILYYPAHGKRLDSPRRAESPAGAFRRTTRHQIIVHARRRQHPTHIREPYHLFFNRRNTPPEFPPYAGCRGGQRQAASYVLVGLDRSRREWVALHAPAPRSSVVLDLLR